MNKFPNNRQPMDRGLQIMIWLSLLLISFIKASPLINFGTTFESFDKLKFNIKDLDTHSDSVFPVEKVKPLIADLNSRQLAITICLIERRFKALDYILALRAPESSGLLKRNILLLVASLNDPEIWSHFFTKNRMNWIFNDSGCFYEQFKNTADPLIGTFSYEDLALFLGNVVFTNPGAYPGDAITALKSYVSSQPQFLLYSSDNIFNGKFTMRVFFDFFELLNGQTIQSVPVYPKLMQLISQFDAKQANATSILRLELPFYDYFSAIEAGRGQYKKLIRVNFASLICIQAVRKYYKTEIGSFIKSFISALVDCHGLPYLCGTCGICVTRVVTEVIDLHTAVNEPLIFYQFLEEIYRDLLVRACSSRVDLSCLDTISRAIHAVVQYYSPTSIPQECFLDGHLRGEALYVLSVFPSHDFEAFLEQLCSAATSAEVFSIPSIETRALSLDPNALSSSLGRLVNPEEAFKYILSGSSTNLLAIRSIYQLYTVETGTFQLIRFRDPPRSVTLNLSRNNCLTAIIIRIRTAYDEIVQILGVLD